MSTNAVKKINQKEYLKKYLSGDMGKKKKKKVKKEKRDVQMTIIDDDIPVGALDRDIDEELLLTGEDAPIIVGEYIEEHPDAARKWRSIAIKEENVDDEETGTVTVKQEKDDSALWGRQENKIKIKDEFSPKRRKKPTPDVSPPRRKKNRKSRSRSKEYNNKMASSSSMRKKETRNRSIERSADQSTSSYRNKLDDRSRKTPRDNSPNRRLGESPIRKDSQSLKRREKSPKSKKSGSTQLPPRIERNASSDQSPPRRRRKDSSDQSPPRRRRKDSSDQSPKRRNRKGSSDQSPLRRNKKDAPDQSPPRRRRKDSSDQSPPRRNRKGSSDQSPPRRRRKNASNMSPLRRRKNLHQSPRNPDDNCTQRTQSPSRRRQSSRSPIRIKQEVITPNNSPSHSAVPRGRMQSNPIKTEPAGSPSPPPTHKGKAMKTLDGKKAGLQDAKSLRNENEQRRRQEERMFAEMSKDVSGRDAELQVRSTGRRGERARKARAEDPEVTKRKEAHEQMKKDLYDRWGKGLKQIEDHEELRAKEAYESNKPLARYANDEDLDRHLREQERAEDPMLEYMRRKKKQRQTEANVPMKPVYEGQYPENRFGIRPGYRWDGVDRSNGYEKKWFAVQNEKQACQEEAYKYSVEDM